MNARALLLLGLLAIAPAAAPPATACGGGGQVLARTVSHPDLPIDDYVEGRLGVLRPTFGLAFLTVAYRHLTPIGLSDVEQRSLVEVLGRRLTHRSPLRDARGRWCEARAKTTSTACPSISRAAVRGYASVDNCLDDAFATAAGTLDRRITEFGADSSTATRFVEGQDAVFAGCSGGGSIPPALPDGTPLEQADRAYHRAAAHLYAWDHDEAIAAFESIAADDSSPWATLAHYLVPRARARKASFLPGPQATVVYQRAQRELEGVLADPGLAEYHAASRRLIDRTRYYGDPGAQRERLSVQLASQRLDETLPDKLIDYVRLSDTRGLASADSDRLSTWLEAVRGGDTTRARRLFAETGDVVWLVAAIIHAQPGKDAAPLLRAAESIAPSSPAFATVRYHHARLLGPSPRAYALATDALAVLGTNVGTSTTTAFAELALSSASSTDELVPHLAARPAVTLYDGDVLDARAPLSLHPAAVGVLSSLSLDALVAVAVAKTLRDPIRPRLLLTAWLRAHWLNRPAVASSFADLVAESNPDLATDLEAVGNAKTRDARRLALVMAMLTAPSSSVMPRVWDSGPVSKDAIETAYGRYWWCGQGRDPAPAFATASERAAARAEHAQLGHSGSDELVREAVALARLLPDDPRVPQMLHLAVRATRYGCRTKETSLLSKAAFRRLHGAYPESPWTAATPYHY